jgi:hypothetical protein
VGVEGVDSLLNFRRRIAHLLVLVGVRKWAEEMGSVREISVRSR